MVGMVIISKPKLKANIKPIQMTNPGFVSQILKRNNSDTGFFSEAEIVYKLEKTDNEALMEIILQLLKQIRHINGQRAITVNVNSKEELIKQLNRYLVNLNLSKSEFTSDIKLLEKNISNQKFFNNNENLDLVINNIENKLKKKLKSALSKLYTI